MILGTLALINMLFFGSMEYFLVDKLEKGVKTYVLEKERRKEILVDLSDAEKEIKAFNKLRFIDPPSLSLPNRVRDRPRS
jgi:hypothetical protein